MVGYFTARAEDCSIAPLANPYLRWPVVFDEYVRNRDVWRCPSARLISGATFVVGGVSDWFSWYIANEGGWGEETGNDEFGPCFGAWPAGWGGDVTDSILQQRLIGGERTFGGATAVRAFVQNIAVGEGANRGRKLAAIQDPVEYVIAADGGAIPYELNAPMVAYPDACAVGCVCWGADWDECPWTQSCGIPQEWKWDSQLRRGLGRHLGGSNLGFLDGSARWYSAEYILTESPRYAGGYWGGSIVEGKLKGLTPQGPTYSPTGEPSNAELAGCDIGGFLC